MNASLEDTIVAPATPEGGGMRALLRLSGSQSREIVEKWLGGVMLRDREAILADACWDGWKVPASAVFFEGPRSYTRENLVEVAIPSSPPLIKAVLARLNDLGARLAQPGEFTKRAFLRGRLDLSRAEGVLELLRARNEKERRAGLLLLEGGLSQRVQALRVRLEGALALLEASLDFEEADTGHIEVETLRREIAAASAGLEEALVWESRRVVPRGQMRAFLWGEPNAGKSSLLNALDPSARAIVSPIPGTTRDCLAGHIRLGDFELTILDAAGVETGADFIAAKAQEMAARFRASCDWVIGVADASQPLPRFLLEGQVDLLVLNKSDLPRVCDLSLWQRRSPIVFCSALHGEGIAALRASLEALVRGEGQAEGERVALSQRHQAAIRRALDETGNAQKTLTGGVMFDAAAAHLRHALAALGEIDGETTPEHILDRIFSQFCIGK